MRVVDRCENDAASPRIAGNTEPGCKAGFIYDQNVLCLQHTDILNILI